MRNSGMTPMITPATHPQHLHKRALATEAAEITLFGGQQSFVDVNQLSKHRLAFMSPKWEYISTTMIYPILSRLPAAIIKIESKIRHLGLSQRSLVELGRFIVGAAGYFVTSVISPKNAMETNSTICEGWSVGVCLTSLTHAT